MACINELETIQQHPGLTFVRSLYQCRELGAALARYATAATVANVRRTIGAGLPSSSSGGSTVSSGAALVANLVLKDLEAPEHSFTCKPSDEGLEVLRLLQNAVFGEAGAQGSLAQCAYLATLAQAAQALELVTAALLDAVCPANCLSLLNVAAACGCAPLRRAARSLALRHFSAASALDAAGLMAMEERHLLALLCSDALGAASELDAFRALAAWTEAARGERAPRFAARLARCVRLSHLTLAELYLLDAHPLVASDRQAVQLVAQVYLHATAGVPLDAPLGLETITQRRSCQPGGADPPVLPADCCLAEHAGRHGSVFEAAACALARRRPAHCCQEGGGAACSPASSTLAAALHGPQPRCSAERPAFSSPAAAVAQAPTPTAGEAGEPCAAVLGLQRRSRVRHHGVCKRVSSRRTLFDPTTDGGAADGWGPKAAAAEAPPPSMPAAPAAGSPGGGLSQLVGSVSLEMSMSPRHASLQGIAQQAMAAAAEPQPANWASRKRLRFE